MSKELLKQLKVGDKVWVELRVLQKMDKEGDIQLERYCYSGKDNMYLNHNNNFSLSNPTELSVRELCEWIKKKDVWGQGLALFGDGSGDIDFKYGFSSIQELTDMVRNLNEQRKEEIKKQIKELQNELNKL